MKKSVSIVLIILPFMFSPLVGVSQMKVHDDGNITVGTLTADNDWQFKVKSAATTAKFENTGGAWGINTEFKVSNNDAKAVIVTKGTVEKTTLFGDGDIVCLDLTETSDRSLKTNITDLKGSLDKVMRLRGVNYEMVDNVNEGISRVYLGFVAQEVELIIPEVVSTHGTDIRGINYGRLVALLAEGMKEQQVMIEDLKAEVAQLQAINSISSGVVNESTTNVVSTLGQNIPNPGLGSTVIPVFIETGIRNAVVCFYDLTGKQVFKKVLSGSGQLTFEVTLADLASGRYLYSLFVDGQEVDTKSMVLVD